MKNIDPIVVDTILKSISPELTKAWGDINGHVSVVEMKNRLKRYDWFKEKIPFFIFWWICLGGLIVFLGLFTEFDYLIIPLSILFFGLCFFGGYCLLRTLNKLSEDNDLLTQFIDAAQGLDHSVSECITVESTLANLIRLARLVIEAEEELRAVRFDRSIADGFLFGPCNRLGEADIRFNLALNSSRRFGLTYKRSEMFKHAQASLDHDKKRRN